MAMFGRKTRPAGGGLGQGVVGVEDRDTSVDDAETTPHASTVVIEGDRVSAARPASTPEGGVEPDGRSEAERIVDEVSLAKPSRAERKAAATADKARRKAEKDEAKRNGVPIQRKSRKAVKAEKAAAKEASGAVENLRLSNNVMIDFYPGMAKDDAIEVARHWAMTHMAMPSLCFYQVIKISDGYAIEVQEGVGRAYLPSVLELAQANPGRLIVVPMIRRKLTVFYSARLGEFESQVLPERQEPPAMPENPPIQAVRGPAMTPIMKQYREWLVAGAVSAVIGGLALLSSLTFYAFDPKAKVPPEWRTTDVALLPVMQWGRLQADATDSYVTRLEFQDGQWRVVRQAVGASVDVATPDTTNSGNGIVGGVVPNAAPDLPPGVTTTPGSTPAPTNIPPPSGVPNG